MAYLSLYICFFCLLIPVFSIRDRKYKEENAKNHEVVTPSYESQMLNGLLAQSRLTKYFFQKYPLVGTAKVGYKYNTQFHKKRKLHVQRKYKLRKGQWKFWLNDRKKRHVVSCTIFALPCAQGIFKIISGTNKQSFCGRKKPLSVVGNTRLLVISYSTYTGKKLNREIKCFISGVTLKEARTIPPITTPRPPTTTTPTTTTTTPYCSIPTPAPADYNATVLNCECGMLGSSGRLSSGMLGPSGRLYSGINYFMQKIFGGSETSANVYPWMVLVHGITGTPVTFHCVGAIISDQWILTAASCIRGTPYSHLGVSVGNHVLSNTSTGISIGVIDGHDFGYDAFLHNNDLMALKLASTLDFVNDATVTPLCLPSPCDNFENKLATVAGWGDTNSNGAPLPDKLHSVDLNVLPIASCNSTWGGTIVNQMLCAGSSNASACVSDVGAPLWVVMYNGQRVLAGIHAWADGCVATNPGIYTRITEYLPEIRNVISGSGVCLSNY